MEQTKTKTLVDLWKENVPCPEEVSSKEAWALKRYVAMVEPVGSARIDYLWRALGPKQFCQLLFALKGVMNAGQGTSPGNMVARRNQ